MVARPCTDDDPTPAPTYGRTGWTPAFVRVSALDALHRATTSALQGFALAAVVSLPRAPPLLQRGNPLFCTCRRNFLAKTKGCCPSAGGRGFAPKATSMRGRIPAALAPPSQPDPLGWVQSSMFALNALHPRHARANALRHSQHIARAPGLSLFNNSVVIVAQLVAA